ncbi:hypothetical protein ACF0H5_015810 [Mactra antiquata]
MNMYEILIGSSLVLCIVYVSVCMWRRRKLKSPPGPEGYLFCGNSFQINSDRLHQDLHVLSEEYGPIFKLNIFGKTIITLSSASLINEAFGTSPTMEFTNDRAANSTSDVFYGRKHIGCANWCKTTQVLREIHSILIQKYFENEPNFEIRIMDEIRRLQNNLMNDQNTAINPDTHLRRYFKNLCSILLIGESLSDIDPETDAPWEFVDSLFTMIEPSVDGALRMFPFLRYLPGYYGNVFRETMTARDKVGKRFFHDLKDTYCPKLRRGIVDACIYRQQEDIAKTGSSLITDEHIKGLIYDTLTAGMTELLKTIRLFILLMCHHQDIQTRLQSEVDSIIGSERHPTCSDRNWMPYTQAVTLEIFRYGSQTPLAIPHKCKKDVNINGYLVQTGSAIISNLYAVHHDEHIWGDPWEFRPERFLDKDGYLLPADHIFMKNVIPFSLGLRACPGQDFARSRVFLTMTSLLQKFRILPPQNGTVPSTDPRLYTRQYPLTEPKFECRFIPRENPYFYNIFTPMSEYV